MSSNELKRLRPERAARRPEIRLISRSGARRIAVTRDHYSGAELPLYFAKRT